MITYDQAIIIATDFLKLKKAGSGIEEFIALSPNERQTSFGWVFGWNDRRYVEGGKREYALDGNLPVVVFKTDGWVCFMPWIPTWETSIDSFAKSLDKLTIR